MAKKNNCPSLQKSLAWCEGMPSHPGIRRRVYFVNKNLIVAYPKLPRDEFGRPTSAILEGNFELQADAYWQYLDVNIDKSTVTSEPQGEAPSQTQLNKATFFHNGIDEEATAAAGWLNNSDNVYIYEDMPGKFRVLGNDRYRTKTTVNQDQGQGTNAAGTTIQVEVTDEVAPPFYYGTIETVDGTVSMDADIEPRVTTESLEIYPGKSKQIDYFPKSDKWTFTSSRPTIATVSNTGLVTALTTATGTTVIACSYDGETVATVRVTVDIEAGDDPGDGGEIGPGEDEPAGGTSLLNRNQLTLVAGGGSLQVNVNSTSVMGESISSNINVAFLDEAVIEGDHTVLNIAPGAAGEAKIFVVIDGETPTLETIDVLVIPDVMTIGPGSTEEIALLPATGWTVRRQNESAAQHFVEVSIDETTGKPVIVAGDNDGSEDIVLTNSFGDELTIEVTVDESHAG